MLDSSLIQSIYRVRQKKTSQTIFCSRIVIFEPISTILVLNHRQMIYLSKTSKSVKKFRLVQKLWTCKVKSGNPAVNRHEERPQSGLRWFSRAQIPSKPSLEQGAVFHSRMSRKLLSTTIASTSVRVQMNSRRPRTAPWLHRLVRRSHYLLNGGISNDRVFIGSYGEEQTLNDCQDGCDENQHQQNRRTEIRIEVKKHKSKQRLTASGPD